MNSNRPKVLYVDDEKANLTAFKYEFQDFYDIHLAQSGKEALSILDKNQDIEVIISDQKMPKMSGVELLKRTVLDYPDMIRIIITAYSDIETVVQAINEGGVYKYIRKPWNHGELRISIENAHETFLLKKKNKALISDLQLANQSLEKKVKSRTLQLEIKNQKLEDLHLEKDGVINVVAHDLQSPFNKILGLVQIMALSGEFNAEQEEYAQLINKVGEQGKELVRDLLDINNSDSEEKAIVLERFELNEFMTEWIKGHNKQLLIKHQKTVLNVNPSPLEINSNKGLLSRILDNLMTNAMKFSEEKTTISISISKKEKTTTFSIKDEGPGISEKDQKLLFKEFQKLSASPTAGEVSHGLGLSIIKSLVDKMGGSIKVNSTVGKGTEFLISFPNR